jgi:hypothetical protein
MEIVLIYVGVFILMALVMFIVGLKLSKGAMARRNLSQHQNGAAQTSNGMQEPTAAHKQQKIRVAVPREGPDK